MLFSWPLRLTPGKHEHVWAAFLADFRIEDLSAPDLITFKTNITSGRLLDRWLAKDEAIEQGPVAGIVRAAWTPRTATGHARLTLHQFPHKIGDVTLPEFRCRPAAALKGEYPPSSDLAREPVAF